MRLQEGKNPMVQTTETESLTVRCRLSVSRGTGRENITRFLLTKDLTLKTFIINFLLEK